MAIKMGKLKTEVICPLCNTIWFLDEGEWCYVHPENKENLEATFYCNECGREVKFNAGMATVIKSYSRRAKEYSDFLFYEEDS